MLSTTELHLVQPVRTEIFLVLEPEGETPLQDMENLSGDKVGINKLVVACSRPPNLGNKLYVCTRHER